MAPNGSLVRIFNAPAVGATAKIANWSKYPLKVDGFETLPFNDDAMVLPATKAEVPVVV